ncbi:PGPGW domain-containing protein [Nocardioides sp. YIM 152315]|uniref:PGPGW domain-containing protein n=1 Tax=Nocardioides sp. YIM 152315 TaxID=3031760 RepID=UPI0023DC2081|nr:PGPGW domain-containing protein [Nocardioides sp. YIM 152315]MDF1606408.1 PGPGW domain-containing protein [Nocardioides sp. YIM 152315]
MSHSLSPRAHALLTRVERWSNAGPVRAVAVKVLVTVGGPLIILAGIAMLVLPGPGLVVIALGFTLLALEYSWARQVLGVLGRGLTRLREAVFPREATRTRRALGVLTTGAFVAGSTALTSAVTALVGTQRVL